MIAQTKMADYGGKEKFGANEIMKHQLKQLIAQREISPN